MKQHFYDYSRDAQGFYRFTSRGKITIIKIVGFTSTSNENIFNLWFGDLLPDNTIDDMAISNNGDMIKVLATVIQIAREFMFEHSNIEVIFKGNTDQRTALYQRILERNYSELISEFVISALIMDEGVYQQILFDTTRNAKYLAFFVTRKL